MRNVHTLITTLAVPREESRASKAFSCWRLRIQIHVSGLCLKSYD